MKRLVIITTAAMLLTLSLGCEDEDTIYDPFPAAPQGVYSVTADNAVYLFWNGPYEADIDYYVIYRSFDPVDNYTEIGQRVAADQSNLDLYVYEYIDGSAVNGQTYYYAVTSVDMAGQESDLSAENVFDTPRPDGVGVIYDHFAKSDSGAFSLNLGRTVPYGSTLADVFIDSDGSGTLYINADTTLNFQTNIQDMGHTASLDDIGWAPEIGWSGLGWAELIPEHTYVIWTDDNHFAKIRVTGFNTITGRVDIEWAFQTDPGNPELVPVQPGDSPSNIDSPAL